MEINLILCNFSIIKQFRYTKMYSKWVKKHLAERGMGVGKRLSADALRGLWMDHQKQHQDLEPWQSEMQGTGTLLWGGGRSWKVPWNLFTLAWSSRRSGESPREGLCPVDLLAGDLESSWKRSTLPHFKKIPRDPSLEIYAILLPQISLNMTGLLMAFCKRMNHLENLGLWMVIWRIL